MRSCDINAQPSVPVRRSDTPTCPDPYCAGPAPQRPLSLILQLADQGCCGTGRFGSDGTDERVADHERGFETSRKRLQPTRCVHGVADYRKREAVLGADIT